MPENLINKVHDIKLNFFEQLDQIGIFRARRITTHSVELQKNWEVKKKFLTRYNINNIQIGVIYGRSRNVILKIDSVFKDKTEVLQKIITDLRFSNCRLFIKTHCQSPCPMSPTKEARDSGVPEYGRISRFSRPQTGCWTKDFREGSTVDYPEEMSRKSRVSWGDKKSRKRASSKPGHFRLMELVQIDNIEIKKIFTLRKDMNKAFKIRNLPYNDQIRESVGTWCNCFQVNNFNLNLSHDFHKYSVAIHEMTETVSSAFHFNKNRHQKEMAKKIDAPMEFKKRIQPFKHKILISFSNIVLNIEDKPLDTHMLRLQK